MLTVSVRPRPSFDLRALIDAAERYAESCPATFVGPSPHVPQSPVVYPAIRVGWYAGVELIARVPETELWVRSGDVEGCTTWDALEAIGRPLPAVLHEVARLGAYSLDVFEDGDEEPQWPDPSEFDACL